VSPDARTAPFEVLVVCTGNIARSPMAQRLLQARLAHDPSIRVGSAGTWGLQDVPMDRHAATALAEVGVDEGGFRSRPLTADLVRASALLLTATREHRVAVLTHDPAALRRTFTLREFARLVEVVDGVPGRPGYVWRTPDALVAAAADARGRVRVAPSEDDVADPHGGPLPAFRACRDLLAATLDVVAPSLAAGHAPVDQDGAGPGPGLQ